MRYLYFIILFVSLLLGGCKGEEKKVAVQKTVKKKTVKAIPPLVQPPFKTINVAYDEFNLDADSSYKLNAKNNYGSVIEIEKGIFVSSAGEKIEGKIKLRYRELHTMNEILLSGIPLNYDAAGMLKRFHSAGMFEIKAFQEDKELFLDSGKVIRVNMASFINDDRHHAFYLDEKNSRDWEYLKDLEGKENPEKKKIIQRAKKKVKEFNMPLEGYFAFNYMALIDVYLNDKSVEIQKKRNDLTLQGKIKEYGVTWSNIYCYQAIDFMGTKQLASLLLWRKLNNEPWPVWASSAICNLTPNTDGTYKLELSQSKGKGLYKATIKPFLPIKSLLSFSPSYWKNKYNLAVKKAVAEEMRKLKLADVFRTLEVHKFGVYNVDRLQKEEDYVQVKLLPKFTDSLEKINDIEVIYLSENFRTVIRYSSSQWNNITLLPDDNAKLFAVLPGNKIALVSSEELKKINYSAYRNETGKALELEFKTIALPINSAEDIAKVLGIALQPV